MTDDKRPTRPEQLRTDGVLEIPAEPFPRPPLLPTGVERRRREVLAVLAAPAQGRPRASSPSPQPDPPSDPGPKEEPGPKSQSVGLHVKISNPVAWTALLVAVIGALFAGWAKVDSAPPTRVEAVAVNQDAANDRVDKLEEANAAEIERLNATIRALACRLDVQSSALRRQGYDPGFGDEVVWLSQYIPDRRVRAAPTWATNKTCPPLPKVPEP